MSIDPLTEKYNTWSPYVFSGNRIIDFRELEGLEPVKPPTPTELEAVDICTGTANCANERLATDGYTDPVPYTPNTNVKIYEGGNETYVRLSTEGVTEPVGKFVVRPEVIDGLTPAEIQAVLNMPNIPTHITDVNASGASMVEGLVNGSSAAGTMQNEILDRLPEGNFTNTRPIPEVPTTPVTPTPEVVTPTPTITPTETPIDVEIPVELPIIMP